MNASIARRAVRIAAYVCGGTSNMKVYKAGDKYIAIHTRGNTVYTAQGGNEEEAKNKVLKMIKKARDYDTRRKITFN